MPIIKPVRPQVSFYRLVRNLLSQVLYDPFVLGVVEYVDQLIVINRVLVVESTEQLINADDVVLDFIPAVGNEPKSLVFVIEHEVLIIRRIFCVEDVLSPELIFLLP